MKQEPRVTLGSVVSVLAGVVTFGGYILLVGGIVAWLNVRTVGVPAISVVADMPRNELFGLGLEALAVWLLLGLIVAFAIAVMSATIRSEPLLPLGTLLFTTVVGGVFVGVWQSNSVVIRVVGSAVLVALVALVVISARSAWSFEVLDEPVSTGIAIVAGVGLGVALELLLVNPGQIWGLIAALLALAFVIWLAIEMLWRRAVAREARYLIGGVPFMRRMQLGSGLNRVSLLRRSRRRSVAAVVLLAVVLAAGAITSRASHAFWAARVTMTNGTCASGTLLVRNSNEVLLAFLKRTINGSEVKGGLVEIPSNAISNVQVIGPPGDPREIQAESCAKAVLNAPPGPFEPYPLVGDSSSAEVIPEVEVIPGPEGKEGERGPKGERGAQGEEGKSGPKGERGAQGEEGKSGPKGERGLEGKEGKRGPRGERGVEGKEGKHGSTGESGARGKAGPRGKRGPRGRRGERGPRGPRGYSYSGMS